MTIAEIKKQTCQSNIQTNNSKIQHYEEQYDSLMQFKNEVSSSQGQFSSVNSVKKSLVSALDGYSAECKTAKKYSSGMNKVLNGVGVTYVNWTFSALLVSINIKLAEYKGKIQALEASNTLLRAQISTLNEQIRKEASESPQ